MSDYFDRVERQLVRRVETGLPRRSRLRVASGHLAVAAAVLVVIVVVGVFLVAHGGTPRVPVGPAAASGVGITLTPAPAAAGGTINRTVQILRARLAAAVPGARVSSAGGRIVVRMPTASRSVRAEILALTAPGRLEFYDWEADAVTPSGKSVASRLPARDPAALEISQGSGGAPPGALGAGGMTVQQVLALTAKLGTGAPRRTEYVDGLELQVPAGFVVLQASGSGSRDPGVYVLRNRPAITTDAIDNPHRTVDGNTGAPDVEFGFTAVGRRGFQVLTATVARRGSRVSGLGETLNQHFAIAVDNKLLSVPFIDSRQYPDGIKGDNGADVVAGFTTQSAKNLAILLRYGPLPVNLTATG